MSDIRYFSNWQARLRNRARQFFTQRLMQQRQASSHTISSYRDTFRLLLKFAQQRLHTLPVQLTFEAIDAPLIVTFLGHLEKHRGLSARSRNLRLTAIHSFFRYVAFEALDHSAQVLRVLAIPSKRFTRTQVHFLARPEVEALLAAPNKCTWFGRRDHVFQELDERSHIQTTRPSSNMKCHYRHSAVGLFSC